MKEGLTLHLSPVEVQVIVGFMIGILAIMVIASIAMLISDYKARKKIKKNQKEIEEIKQKKFALYNYPIWSALKKDIDNIKFIGLRKSERLITFFYGDGPDGKPRYIVNVSDVDLHNDKDVDADDVKNGKRIEPYTFVSRVSSDGEVSCILSPFNEHDSQDLAYKLLTKWKDERKSSKAAKEMYRGYLINHNLDSFFKTSEDYK
jgi:hypothetical protein